MEENISKRSYNASVGDLGDAPPSMPWGQEYSENLWR